MSSTPPWSPTQQVRALLLLHELAALLADEARARTLHGHRNLAEALTAVGKRCLPQIIAEISTWPALRLVGARDTLKTAIEQHASGAVWAERTCTTAVALLTQGERFTDAGHRIDQLARAIASVDAKQTRRLFEQQLAILHRHRCSHGREEGATAVTVWSQAIGLLVKAGGTIELVLTPPPPDASASPPVDANVGREPSATGGSTPYQPASISETDSDNDGGSTRALRRRGGRT